MEWIYSCPKCTAILNPGVSIVLLGHYQGCDTLLAFHPEPGNYEVAVPYNMTINRGEVWDFTCPVCHESLNLADEEKLAALDMTDGKGNWHKVIFSRIAGEQATFVIGKGPKSMMVDHGKDKAKYGNGIRRKYT